jgi:hypothetical protein
MFLLPLAFILGCSTSKPSVVLMKTSYTPLTAVLDVEKFPPILALEITNTSDKPIMVWYDGFSDGYEAPIFKIRDRRSNTPYFVSRRLVDWTANRRDYYTILPGKAERFSYNLLDNSWHLPPGLDLSNRDATVLGILIYPRSSFSERFGIFDGAIASEVKAISADNEE